MVSIISVPESASEGTIKIPIPGTLPPVFKGRMGGTVTLKPWLFLARIRYKPSVVSVLTMKVKKKGTPGVVVAFNVWVCGGIASVF